MQCAIRRRATPRALRGRYRSCRVAIAFMLLGTAAGTATSGEGRIVFASGVPSYPPPRTSMCLGSTRSASTVAAGGTSETRRRRPRRSLPIGRRSPTCATAARSLGGLLGRSPGRTNRRHQVSPHGDGLHAHPHEFVPERPRDPGGSTRGRRTPGPSGSPGAGIAQSGARRAEQATPDGSPWTSRGLPLNREPLPDLGAGSLARASGEARGRPLARRPRMRIREMRAAGPEGSPGG